MPKNTDLMTLHQAFKASPDVPDSFFMKIFSFLLFCTAMKPTEFVDILLFMINKTRIFMLRKLYFSHKNLLI